MVGQCHKQWIFRGIHLIDALHLWQTILTMYLSKIRLTRNILVMGVMSFPWLQGPNKGVNSDFIVEPL